jgi:hypothetical protein
MKDDQAGKWSPLSTLNTAPLSAPPPPPSSPGRHAPPLQPPSSAAMTAVGSPYGSHSPYHHHHSHPGHHHPGHHHSHHSHHVPANTFSSPLSALLGPGSYLFNTESKGPTVQIF